MCARRRRRGVWGSAAKRLGSPTHTPRQCPPCAPPDEERPPAPLPCLAHGVMVEAAGGSRASPRSRTPPRRASLRGAWCARRLRPRVNGAAKSRMTSHPSPPSSASSRPPSSCPSGHERKDGLKPENTSAQLDHVTLEQTRQEGRKQASPEKINRRYRVRRLRSPSSNDVCMYRRHVGTMGAGARAMRGQCGAWGARGVRK
ncbi:hypothetical protein B0H17DRAFT_1093733 [Mycena rosella]|uniref:Uncharacterized protein n=1 Tax=Mycena rosella TaxID=1033263 RepID=A0AAD7CTF4_MYCRO|nr:hypothetical protein B0H17DRAFT_1093733 [Mycena rosella]